MKGSSDTYIYKIQNPASNLHHKFFIPTNGETNPLFKGLHLKPRLQGLLATILENKNWPWWQGWLDLLPLSYEKRMLRALWSTNFI